MNFIELKKAIVFVLFLTFALVNTSAQNIKGERTVLLGKDGVLKWADSKKEVALFGANYCVPSACDYRAAGYFTKDRKKVIDQDLNHFVRMGWDGLRVCVWGDWENSDKDGNLINNDHLDLMDYLIAKATEEGIYMLFSPIVTYSSQWPDAMNRTAHMRGFSNYFKKSELGQNSAAIAAQENYLKQILNHINPYSKRAIKNEPNILFIEMINEPTHHSDDVEGSIRYMNALVDAVRSTGCKKILFHNISQDFSMALPIQKSKIQGVSFAWYPTGLNSGRTLNTNFLRTVDRYDLMLTPELKSKAKIVYEFDQPDLLSPTMYPAMARTFRSVGAQFASIFSYDMLASAPYNMGWQTHFINMVCTPQKAVSAIIASEAMHQLPRMKTYGNYPANTSFGDFRISYEENVSEYNSKNTFMYAGSTKSSPKEIEALNKIVGYGSSPVVEYEGEGIYFLDKMGEGIWRLEMYPDAILVRDPFETLDSTKVASRIIHREWTMSLQLPDLGSNFKIASINTKDPFSVVVQNGTFKIRPGIYLISKDDTPEISELAKRKFKKFDTYSAPESHDLPVQATNYSPSEFLAGKPVEITSKIIDEQTIDSVYLFIRPKGKRFQNIKMVHQFGYTYRGQVPAALTSSSGFLDYCITAYQNGKSKTFPEAIDSNPLDWNFTTDKTWNIKITEEKMPLLLFNAKDDSDQMAFTRIGDDIRQGIFKLIPSSIGEPAIRMLFPANIDESLEDYTASLSIKSKIQTPSILKNASALEIDAKGASNDSEFFITLVEADGTAWASKIKLTVDYKSYRIPLAALKPSKGVMLPHGFPGRWNYWIEPATGRGTVDDEIKIEKVEHLQFSLRPGTEKLTSENSVEITNVKLIFQ